MTTITHTPDGPRFDGMTVGEIVSWCEAQADRKRKLGLLVVPGMFDAIAAAFRHLSEWQPIETVRKDCLVDILINGEIRWCDCYYDQICDQWRTSGPSNHLAWVPARAVTHWRLPPPLPPGPGAAP